MPRTVNTTMLTTSGGRFTSEEDRELALAPLPIRAR